MPTQNAILTANPTGATGVSEEDWEGVFDAIHEVKIQVEHHCQVMEDDHSQSSQVDSAAWMWAESEGLD